MLEEAPDDVHLGFVAILRFSAALSHAGLRKNVPQRPRCSAGQLHKGCRCWCVPPRWIMVAICLCSELQWAGGLGLDLSTCFLLGGPTDGGMFFSRLFPGTAPRRARLVLEGSRHAVGGPGTKLSRFQEECRLGHPSCLGRRSDHATPRTLALRRQSSHTALGQALVCHATLRSERA